jgi:hypothetical protein
MLGYMGKQLQLCCHYLYFHSIVNVDNKVHYWQLDSKNVGARGDAVG